MNLPPTNTVVRVQAQPALLDALISNLLDNALRYTPEGGRVTVSVSGTERGAELCVDDNGPGIPAESRERVFERFVRLANDAEGTGLGLAIVREIAAQHGARIDIGEGRQGRGTRIAVSFPA